MWGFGTWECDGSLIVASSAGLQEPSELSTQNFPCALFADGSWVRGFGFRNWVFGIVQVGGLLFLGWVCGLRLGWEEEGLVLFRISGLEIWSFLEAVIALP